MLEKRKVLDQIEIKENGIIFVRELNQILDNGVVVSSVPHRSCFEPILDIDILPVEVRPYALLAWTEDKIQAYKDKIKSDLEILVKK